MSAAEQPIIFLRAGRPISAISRDATVSDLDGIELTALTYLDGFDLEGTGEVLLSLPTDSIKSFDIDLSPLR